MVELSSESIPLLASCSPVSLARVRSLAVRDRLVVRRAQGKRRSHRHAERVAISPCAAHVPCSYEVWTGDRRAMSEILAMGCSSTRVPVTPFGPDTGAPDLAEGKTTPCVVQSASSTQAVGPIGENRHEVL